MEKLTGLFTPDGEPVLSQEYAQWLREHPASTRIIAQAGGQENMLASPAQITIVGGKRGGPLTVDTKVVTPFGFRNIGELKAGDIVSSADGGMQRVIYRKNHGTLPCYEITFCDGAHVTASTDHLWNVKMDGDSSWRVMTTESIVTEMKKGRLCYIPVARPAQLCHRPGEKTAQWYGSFFGRLPDARSGEGKILAAVRNAWDKSLAERIRALGAICRKALGSSKASLTGCTLRIRRRNVAEAFKYIVDSCGLLCFMKKEHDGTFSLAPRRADKRLIDSFRPAGHKECCCIAVENKSSLFVAGDFIVTHNSKSFSLLLEAKKDVMRKHYRAVILRNERPDLEDLIEVSEEIFSQDGVYNRSQSDMTWNFSHGGKLKFSYYADDFEEFKKRFQGKQIAFIGIDEITHCPYRKFKYLLTVNRNAYGIKSRIWGTCNPDPDSWVARFIEWWYDDDGFPIPERNGVVRYCYMPSDNVGEIYWGDTKEEVFDKCGDTIMKHWKPEYGKYGSPAELSIKSATFIEAKLEDNKILMESDPEYLSNLMNQSEEQVLKDLDGCWKQHSQGSDMIKLDDMETFFTNSEQLDDGQSYATADVAFQGGDNFVMWRWVGYHIKDVFVCRVDAKRLVSIISAKLLEWGVPEGNFTYDMQGLGQMLKGFFPDALPFNNQSAPIAERKRDAYGVKSLYKDLKSQCAYLLYKKIRDAEISIDPRLLNLTFSGNGYGRMPLREILMKERKCVNRSPASDGKAFQIIQKSEMKKLIGHSPDFFEALIFRMAFTLQRHRHEGVKGLWCI